MDTNTAKPKLTARQEEILGLISDAISRSGLPPTRAEIATRLGFASASAAEEHLRALARKGYVELTSGQHYAKIDGYTTWKWQGWNHPLINPHTFV